MMVPWHWQQINVFNITNNIRPKFNQNQHNQDKSNTLGIVVPGFQIYLVEISSDQFLQNISSHEVERVEGPIYVAYKTIPITEHNFQYNILRLCIVLSNIVFIYHTFVSDRISNNSSLERKKKRGKNKRFFSR